jgi:hypothetical protein
MSELAKLKKTELIDVIKKLKSENKELRMAFENIRKDGNRPFTAVSVLRVGDTVKVVKVPFNVNEFETIGEYKAQPWFVQQDAKKLLIRIIQDDQVYEKETGND